MKILLLALVSSLFIFSVMPTVFAGSSDFWATCATTGASACSSTSTTVGQGGTCMGYVCCSGSWVSGSSCPTSTYSATFDESGLLNGVTWSVTIGGTTKSATVGSGVEGWNGFGTSIVFSLSTGLYTWSTSSVSCGTGCQLVPTSGSGSFSVPPSQTIYISYQTQYQLTMASSPSSAGTTSPVTNSWLWESAGNIVTISASPSSGYSFSSWTGSGTGSSSATTTSTTVTMNGPITEQANFVSSSQYCSTPGSICATGSCVLPGGYTCGSGSRSTTLCSSTNTCTVAGSPQSCTVGCGSGYTCSSGTCVPTSPTCSGTPSLSLSPNPTNPSSTVATSSSGLSNCDGQTLTIKDYNGCTNGATITSCTISGGGCSASFTSPSLAGQYGYYACASSGSSPQATLTVQSSTCGNGVCDSGETQLTCPQDCKTTVSVSPSYNLYPGESVGIVVAFNDSRFNFTSQQTHNVFTNLVIDPGLSTQLTWTGCLNSNVTLSNSMMNQQVSCMSATGTCTVTTTNGYAQISTTCNVPSSVIAGTHTLQATPTIYTSMIVLTPATTFMTIVYSSVNDWVNSVVRSTMSMLTSFASALKVN